MSSDFASNTSGRSHARADGHAILIMEASEGERTFSDYKNEAECLETIVNMYEEYRAACCQQSEGDLKEFCKWMNDFYRIEMFVYDQGIARYKHHNREKLALLFEEDRAKLRHQNQANETHRRLNGHGRGSVGSASMDDEDVPIGEQIMDEENWDE